MRVAVILLLVSTACAGTFHPDFDEEGSSGEEGTTSQDPSGTASQSSTTSTGTTVGGDGSQGTTDANDDDSESEDGSDGSSDSGSSEGSDTEDIPLGCGDDVRDLREECDGEDLAGQTCISRGMPGGGLLKCTADCTFDVSACNLGGSQPDDGLWSSCVSYEECPAGPEWDCEDNFCSYDCNTTADCGPSPGGSAFSECRPFSAEEPEQGGRCYLSCENGESCPTGMLCWGASYCRSAS
jgi:hypothetical protein